MSEHIVPAWDVVKGEYSAATATVKGMGQIHGGTRAEFEKAVLDAVNDKLPGGTKVVIEYSDEPVELVCLA